MNSCCVIGCKNQNIGNNSGVIFYKFPEERVLRKKWIDACIKNGASKDKHWAPNDDTVICNVHFVSGEKRDNDWHPDYVPSVFRSLRKVITKAKGKHLDDSDDESSRRKSKSFMKKSLATPTRNTTKIGVSAVSSLKKSSLSFSPEKKLVGRPKKDDLVKKTNLIRPPGRPKKILTPKDEETAEKVRRSEQKKLIDETIDTILRRSETPSPRKHSEEEEEEEEVEDESTKDTMAKKRKRVDDDEGEEAPPLKTLSVVLERTSAKRIKLSTGEITIKEEPESETDYLISPTEFVTPARKPQCKKCRVWELKCKKLDALLKGGSADKCRYCPIIEGKLKKVEEELDQIIDAKVSKCQKCSSLEMKCRKAESEARKAQTEIAKYQSKLAGIELSEETFKKYRNKVKMYTGFPNYDALMLVFDHIKPRLPTDAVKFLSPFQMFVIALMRLRLNFPFWDLTYRFGASPNHIQSFYPQYISVLEAELSHVVLWPKANLYYRLEVLAANLKQSFAIIQDSIDVNTLVVEDDGTMSEYDKTVRVCAALYHISQLVSSNHSQQLIRILKSKDDTDRVALMKKSNGVDESEDSMEKSKESEDKKSPPKDGEESLSDKGEQLQNGEEEEVDDSDIFFEDFTKDIGPGGNSNDSLKLECKNLQKELEDLNQKLSQQFRFYTGMRNFEVFNNLLGFLVSHVTHISKERLTYFQQLHLVLIRLKMNLEVQDLCYIFQVDPDHIVYLTKSWIEVIAQKLSRYIDWPAGIEDSDGEKRLLGTVKLKYQILWSPHCAPRNKETGREREKFDSRLLLRACAALYNIDDIEVFKDGKKESKAFQKMESLENKNNEELEQQCRALRTELYDLRKCNMSAIATCFSEESFEKNDRMVTYYTGFPSFETLINVFNLIVPVTKGETRKGISPFQQFLILLLRLKLNLATQDISLRFGMGHSNTHKFIQDWLMLLHAQLAPHITWPDDDEDVEVFTDMLRKTYAYLRTSIYPRKRDIERKSETGVYDTATLVCAGLYNVGEVSFCPQSDSEFDSFDDEW